jgi:hypothetical protein
LVPCHDFRSNAVSIAVTKTEIVLSMVFTNLKEA